MEGSRKITKNPGEISPSPHRDSNLKPAEYDAGARRSVTQINEKIISKRIFEKTKTGDDCPPVALSEDKAQRRTFVMTATKLRVS